MNVNGDAKNTTLFTSEGVPFEGGFATLNKNQILKSSSPVGYSVKSFINEDWVRMKQLLKNMKKKNIKTILKKQMNIINN